MGCNAISIFKRGTLVFFLPDWLSIKAKEPSQPI